MAEGYLIGKGHSQIRHCSAHTMLSRIVSSRRLSPLEGFLLMVLTRKTNIELNRTRALPDPHHSAHTLRLFIGVVLLWPRNR